jgi:hypothetical protein
MRMRSTIERRRDRYEFVYKYRQEIVRLSAKDKWGDEVRQFVEQHARGELQYSRATFFFDIFMTLYRDYQKILKHEAHFQSRKGWTKRILHHEQRQKMVCKTQGTEGRPTPVPKDQPLIFNLQ